MQRSMLLSSLFKSLDTLMLRAIKIVNKHYKTFVSDKIMHVNFCSYLNFSKRRICRNLANPRFIILNLYIRIFAGLVPNNEAKERCTFQLIHAALEAPNMQYTILKLDTFQEIEEYIYGMGNSNINRFRYNRGIPVTVTPHLCWNKRQMGISQLWQLWLGFGKY